MLPVPGSNTRPPFPSSSIRVAAIEEASEESQPIVSQAVVRAVLLIVIAITGYVIAMLAYRSLALRMFGAQE